jgi:short-subunit dehydrogenase
LAFLPGKTQQMTGKNILITGASSGIGAALARAFAAPGLKLALWGRNQERLGAVVEQCRGRGAEVETASFDLLDFGRLTQNLTELDVRCPLDLAVFNAGIGGSLPQDRAAQDVTATEKMAGLNFTAPAIGANLIAERMAERHHGRIVLVGSVAESFPLPMAPLYSGSKAGLALFAEALGLRLARYGVGVTLVAPGFVDTPMSRSLDEPKPFLIGADRAAAIIVRKVAAGRRRIVVPWQFAVIGGLSAVMPRPILRFVLARQMRGVR